MQRVRFLGIGTAIFFGGCGAACTGDTQPSTEATRAARADASFVVPDVVAPVSVIDPLPYPAEAWMTIDARDRFDVDEDNHYWREQFPGYKPGQYWSEWTTLPPNASCSDIELHCRFTAYSNTAHFCDPYCAAQALTCEADARWDMAFSLARCQDDNSCGTELSANASLASGVDSLIEAANGYYTAAVALMQSTTESGAYVRNHGIECQMVADKLINHGVVDHTGGTFNSSASERLQAKIIYNIERFFGAAEEAVSRLLARADAGYRRTMGAGEAAWKEWYSETGPRATALEILLGSGLRQFPCTIDPRPAVVRAGSTLFEAAGREPRDELVDVCGLARGVAVLSDDDACPPSGSPSEADAWNAVLAAYGTTRSGYQAAKLHEAESLKARYTATDLGFPAHIAMPATSFAGIPKPRELWYADSPSMSSWSYDDPGTTTGTLCVPVGTLSSTRDPGYFNDRDDEGNRVVCVTRPGWTTSDSTVYAGALRLAASLTWLWSELEAYTGYGSVARTQFPRVGQILSTLVGAEQFTTTLLGRGAVDTAGDTTYRAEIILEIAGFSDKALGAGVDTSFLQGGQGVPWATLPSVPADIPLRLVARQYAAARLSGGTAPEPAAGEWANELVPDWCQYNTDRDRLRCGFAANYRGHPWLPSGLSVDTVDLAKVSHFPDYVGSLPTDWGSNGLPSDDPLAGEREGLWVLVMGDAIFGWANAQAIHGFPPNPNGWVHCDGASAPSDVVCSEPTGSSEFVSAATQPFYAGGRIETLAERALSRNAKDCRQPAANSLGLASDLIPALENEVTWDPIPYESAYNVYLEAAEDAAATAGAQITSAEEAQNNLHRDKLLYELAIEAATAEAGHGVAQLCGDIGISSLEDPAAVRESCAPTASPFSYWLAPAADDVRRRWMDSLVDRAPIALADPPLDYCRSIMGPADDTLPLPDQVEQLQINLPCQTLIGFSEAIGPLTTMPVPDVLHDGSLDVGDGAWGGRVAQVVGSIDTELDLVGGQVSLIGSQFQIVDASLDRLDAQFQHAEAVAGSRYFNAGASFVEALIGCIASSGISCSSAGARENLLAAEQAEYEARLVTHDVRIAVESFVATRNQALVDIGVSLDRIRSFGWELEGLAREVEFLAAKGGRDERIATAESMSRDTWVRESVAAESRIALRSFQRAKKLEFIARRAIEFKFVVDLPSMANPMLLGEAPSDWANDLFLDGYASDMPVERFIQPTIEYTNHLRDFVNYYSSSYPFQNGQTTVVVSMKDDLGSSMFPCSFPGDDVVMTRPCTDQNGDIIQDLSDPGVTEVHHAYDYDGVLLRHTFRRHCRNSPPEETLPLSESCENRNGEQTDYFVRPFPITLIDLAEGGRLDNLGLSADNFNHRIRHIAVNLVGSNVRDCSGVIGGVSSCYAAAFVPYDLIQSGTVWLRDHSGDVREFALPRGGVRSGKALASERFITSPIAAADEELLSQYYVGEFAGRPLQGGFELRLHNANGLVFSEIEDVQVVVRLDYWSPFEAVP